MNRSTAIAASLLFALACMQSDASSDPRVTVVRGAATCRKCTIAVESLAYIPHPGDTVAVEPWSVPERDSRGRYYIIEESTRRTIYVLGPDGRVIDRFGKAGKGPGELDEVIDVKSGRGDSLYVLEYGRALIFSPEHEYVREFHIPWLIHGYRNTSAVLADGRIVSSGSPNRISILSPDGNLDSVSRVGSSKEWIPGERRPEAGIWLQESDTVRCQDCGRRIVRASQDAKTIWSGTPNAYVLENHDLSGLLLRRIVRDVNWFPPWGEAERSQFTTPLTNEFLSMRFRRPRLLGVRQTSDGLLWAHAYREDDRNPIPPATDFVKLWQGGGDMDLEQHMITVIEVIDPATGKVLATARLPGTVQMMTGDLAIQAVKDSLNLRAGIVLRMSLRRGS